MSETLVLLHRPGMALVLALLLLSACDKPEPVPSWVMVEDYSVAIVPGQGTAAHQLTEVYAYTQNRFLGVYPIPGRIPILEEGPTTLDLFPGIRANGIKATPDIYPFLGRHRSSLNLIPDSRDTIRPVFTYDPLARIRFVEDFENGNIFFNQVLAGKAMTVVPEAFEGNGAGLIVVDTFDRIFEVASPVYADITQNGTPVYLEIHYRNEAPFLIGIMGEDSGIPGRKEYAVGLWPRETWNKVYISLTDLVNLSGWQNIQILIRAALPLDPNVPEARIWIDNIKLVHQ